MSCSGACGNRCAAKVALQMLAFCADKQSANVQAPLPVEPLFILCEYIKKAVCGQTATLPFDFVPDLVYLLSQLPNDMRYTLEVAIVQALSQSPQVRTPQGR